MSKSLTIRISDRLEKQLEGISRKEHVSVSDLVRKSLERFLTIRRFRQLRAQVLPFAESQDFLTDEDIFKKIS